MSRVVCPVCKAGFEASISREDFCINCISCGVAFNAARYLDSSERAAITERRPGSGSGLSYDRGTMVAGSMIAPNGPPPPPLQTEPAGPDTRTGLLPYEDAQLDDGRVSGRSSSRYTTGLRLPVPPPPPSRELLEKLALAPETPAPSAEAPGAPVHAQSDAPLDKGVSQAGEHKTTTSRTSFFEASSTTARFRPLNALLASEKAALEAHAGEADQPAPRDLEVAPDLAVPNNLKVAQTTSNALKHASTGHGLAAHTKDSAVQARAIPPTAAGTPSSSRAPSSAAMKPLAAPDAEAQGDALDKAQTRDGTPAKPAKPRETASSRLRRPPVLEGDFGPYIIQGEIARGGVGAVFRARDRTSGDVVALKVLLDGEAADEVERERFRRECETAKSLSLPGMVKIYAVGEVDEKPFMAMELVDGQSLDKLIPRETLSVHDSLVLIESVADTVGALHEAGYVHRDLKPANILLDAYGAPKVADFGLVKSLDEVTRLTASGLVCGTPAYMAPEQARGDGNNVNAKSDVWALGAMLYEMLTGEPPFQAENALRLMMKITKEPPRKPGQVNPRVPKDVEWIVLKCLEKNPERRYPDARALHEDIKRFMEGHPIEARKGAHVTRLVRSVQDHKKVLAGVAFALVAVVMVAVLVRMVWTPQEAEPLAQKGREALKALKLDEAEAHFRRALDLDPKHAQAHLGLGLTLGSRSIDLRSQRVVDPLNFKSALEHTAQAGELKQDLADESAAQAAKLYRAANMYHDEARELERAIRLKGDQPEFHQALGVAYWHLGVNTRQRVYFEKAMRSFREVLARRPDFPHTREYIKQLQQTWLSRHDANPEQPSQISASREP